MLYLIFFWTGVVFWIGTALYGGIEFVLWATNRLLNQFGLANDFRRLMVRFYREKRAERNAH